MFTEIETPGRLGELIKETRKAKGVSQDGLAEMIGTGRRFVVDLENGKDSCHLGKTIAACRALGLEIIVGPPDGE